MRISKFALLLAVTEFIAPKFPSAQSLQAVQNKNGSAFGVVLDSASQNPVENALLEFHSFNTGRTAATLTGADGMFDLAGLPEGQYKLVVSAPLCEPYEMTASIAGRTGPFSLEVVRAGGTSTPVNNSVVSVQELKMSGKANPAFQKGTHLLLRGKPRQSVGYFEKALSKDPGYYRAYHNLGIAEYQIGDKDRAKDAFQRAIDLTNGGFAPSDFALAIILFENHKFRQAEELIQRGLVMEPGSSIGKYYLGLVQFAFNRLPDAEQSAHEALLDNADQPGAHILLAAIHERNHDPYAVERDVANYLQLDPHGSLENAANALLLRAQQQISENASDAKR